MTGPTLKPPAAPNTQATELGDRAPRAASSRLEILRKRAEFIRASKAGRQATPGFHLQARRRSADEPATGIRVGFTCSKKVGNAVARNRAKRRLREIARLELPVHGLAGWDYVLVGKCCATASHEFAAMRRDLADALASVHRRATAQ